MKNEVYSTTPTPSFLKGSLDVARYILIPIEAHPYTPPKRGILEGA